MFCYREQTPNIKLSKTKSKREEKQIKVEGKGRANKKTNQFIFICKAIHVIVHGPLTCSMSSTRTCIWPNYRRIKKNSGGRKLSSVS